MRRGFGVGCRFEFMGSIFYVLSGVDCNTYFIDTKMGGGKRPDATFWETHRAKICL